MTLLLYGAYGYTGELIAREAVDRGIDLVVAGRNGTKTRGLGAELGVDSRVFDLADAPAHLDGVDVLLNCAGPFVHTHEPMVEACLETGTDYLDVTGELSVFESIAQRDREAEKADVCLLPGVGFDVVPTDCLAAHLHDRLPGATHLTLGFDAPANLSGGTLATILEQAGTSGKVRRNGSIEDVELATQPREIDFGSGPKSAIRIPWGDVSTAYYSTGIENIEVYTAVPERATRALRVTAPLRHVTQIGPVKRSLQALARQFTSGPSADERERGRAFVWGEATDGERTVTSRLVTPESYGLTVDAATTAVQRLLETELRGYQTPATAFDPEFVLGLDHVDGFFDESFATLVGTEHVR